MSTKIEIWLVGNTGLRNPNRIQDGFAIFANSPYVGNLRGRDNEIGFMRLLDEKGIIQNENGKDESGSHARKWRLMFSRNGFIYPQLKKKDGEQEELGPLDEITPFGRMEMSRNVQSGNTQNLKSMVIQRSFPKWSVAERRKTAAASNQAACCACTHSRYLAGGSPSGLRV